MARITYDDRTAAAYKAVREIPRDGLEGWRDTVRRHLSPSPGMTVADIGAGTGRERLRRAVQDAGDTPSPEPRTNWLDLLVLR